MLRTFVLSIVLLALCYTGTAQNCGRSISCGDCINIAGCVWCTDGNFTASRCISAATVNTSGCVIVENPSGSLGQETPSLATNPINLRNIDMNLRVGQPQEFTVRVTSVRNLPLDLYILMDLSSSMGPVLESVQDISGQIIDRVQNITNNVNLAFGSFNDKNLSPYTYREGPATEEAPYAFLHRFDFSSNTSAFSEAITLARVTRNIDAAENTLEALAQVVTCDGLLGWRPRDQTQVARLILVLTDQGFHYSGEGKFAGILNPYLGNCLLTRTGNMLPVEFTEFASVDYPSVGQFVELIRNNDVNVIFTVPGPLMETYTELVSFTSGRATTSTLNINGAASEILDTIENEYRRLLRDITLRSTDTSGQISVEITPSCPGGSTLTADGMGCAGVQLEQQATFTVSLTLNSCDGLDGGQTKALTMDAGAFGTFTVTVNGICNCGCEADQVPFSTRCNGRGNFSCGVCVCEEGYCGEMCELTLAETDTCPRGGAAFFNDVCSNRGLCNCVCQCDEGTFGPACECDTTSPQCKANLDSTEICSGRGTCCNRMCTCHNSELGNPFRGTVGGEFCQCEPVEEVCVYEGVLCNNAGECGCDSCDCRSNFEGTFCQIPVEAECGVDIDEECIPECHPLGGPASGPPTVCQTSSCNRNRPTIIADLTETPTDEEIQQIAEDTLGSSYTIVRSSGTSETLMCSEQVDICEYSYFLLRNGTNIAVVVDRQIVCVAVGLPIPSYAIGLIALGVVLLLIILIIIIIKIIFVILDYIEVKKWQRETQGADFSKNQNPLYQSPETKYTNVMYGKAL